MTKTEQREARHRSSRMVTRKPCLAGRIRASAEAAEAADLPHFCHAAVVPPPAGPAPLAAGG